MKDALEVIVTQGMSTTFGVKSEEYLIMREAVMLIHSTNTSKSELAEEEDWVVDSEFRKGLRKITRLATGGTHWYVPGDDNNMTQIDIEHVERAMKVSDYENAIPGLPEERAGKKPKPLAGNQELNKWVEYTIKVVLVTYEEQLRHSTMIPGERIGEGYKPVMEQSSEERWELFKELCDLHLVHRNEKSETANFEHNVQNHEPFTGNQCEHAINFQRRLLVNLTTDKASIRESMESTKRAKEGLLGLRDEEEAMLIRENRIVELTAWERNRKVSKEEMESELGKLLKWIKERTAGGVQRSSRAVGNRLNRKLAQLELVETDGIEEMCGKLGVQKIAYKGSDDTISFSWSFIMDPQAPQMAVKKDILRHNLARDNRALIMRIPMTANEKEVYKHKAREYQTSPERAENNKADYATGFNPTGVYYKKRKMTSPGRRSPDKRGYSTPSNRQKKSPGTQPQVSLILRMITLLLTATCVHAVTDGTKVKNLHRHISHESMSDHYLEVKGRPLGMNNIRKYLSTATAVGRKRYAWTKNIYKHHRLQNININNNNNKTIYGHLEKQNIRDSTINKKRRTKFVYEQNINNKKHSMPHNSPNINSAAYFDIYNWLILKLIWIEKWEHGQNRKRKKVSHWIKWRKHYGLKQNMKWRNKIIYYGDIWDPTKGYPGEGPDDRRGKKQESSTNRGDKRWFNSLKMWGGVPRIHLRDIGHEDTIGPQA